MVSGRTRGDLPDTPAAPGAARHVVRFAVSGETLALLPDARIALTEATGERPDDDALIATLCRAVLDRGDGGAASRARHQIALTICEACDRAWQDGGGQAIEVTPEVVERARCDAQHLGRVDAAVPARATQDVSPSVRRQVWRRDHSRCIVPGCRSTRFLDLHHIEWRCDGGDHSADNLGLTCTGHHLAVHEGRLVIRGRVSTGLVFLHADGRPFGAPPPESAGPVPPTPEPAMPEPSMPETPAQPPVGDAVDAIRRTGYSLAEARRSRHCTRDRPATADEPPGPPSEAPPLVRASAAPPRWANVRTPPDANHPSQPLVRHGAPLILRGCTCRDRKSTRLNSSHLV